MALLDDIGARLVAQGVGTLGTNIFASSKAVIPTGNGPYLTVTANPGLAPTRTQNQAPAASRRPMIMIQVRASNYAVAEAMAQAAYTALDGIFGLVINGTMYVKITARQEPGDLGLDGAGRAMSGFNLDAERA